MEILEKLIETWECCLDENSRCDLACPYWGGDDETACARRNRDTLGYLKGLANITRNFRTGDDLIRREDADPRNLANPRRLNGEPYTDFERGYNDGVIDAYWVARSAPAVEAEPVVHAHWEVDRTFMPFLSSCSKCGFPSYIDGAWEWDYCPYCGAHMDEEVANE